MSNFSKLHMIRKCVYLLSEDKFSIFKVSVIEVRTVNLNLISLIRFSYTEHGVSHCLFLKN